MNIHLELLITGIALFVTTVLIHRRTNGILLFLAMYGFAVALIFMGFGAIPVPDVLLST